MPANSLINIGELSRPATVLIEKISGAVGTVWEPRQIRRVAQARADEAMILAQSEIEIEDLHRRAAKRFVEEETRKQSNIESITRKAIENLEPDAPVEDVEDDWITNFFEKSRIVSDDDMQKLWSRILAGEANSPGSFARKTVNLVSDLDRSSAELFVTLCRFVWEIDDTLGPVVLNYTEQLYQDNGMTLFSLGELESIGLIRIGLGFEATNLPKKIRASYYGRPAHLTFPNEKENSLPVGKVLFTPSGIQLYPIINSTPIGGCYDFICGAWGKDSRASISVDRE